MNNELSPYSIALIVGLILLQIRIHTSKRTREWIASRSRKVVAWILNRGDRFLHAFLMSPVNPRRVSSKETKD
jgi:hypothetical protein